MAVAAAASTKKETMAEMAAALLRAEGEKIDVVPTTKEGKKGVLSDADLEVLLDRRPEVFLEMGFWRRCGRGWSGLSTKWWDGPRCSLMLTIRQWRREEGSFCCL